MQMSNCRVIVSSCVTRQAGSVADENYPKPGRRSSWVELLLDGIAILGSTGFCANAGEQFAEAIRAMKVASWIHVFSFHQSASNNAVPSPFFHSPAIRYLRSKPPGSFVVRDSNSFPGAFGLAVKVAQVPQNITPKSGK